MDSNFWLERWARGETGFHQQHTNEYLQKYWSQLAVPKGTTVLVPLCGKSLDMLWLHDQGYPVLGVEIARTAVSDFFKAWGVDAQVTPLGAFEQWTASRGASLSADARVPSDAQLSGGTRGITVLCGDFFELEPSFMAHVGAVFDRAALIALPPQMRGSYARKLLEILPTQIPLLLITLDYEQSEMPGPPFAVGDREVHALFATSPVTCLDEIDVSATPENARFRQRGVSRMLERVYRIDAVI